ncbi:YihY/virulence factor BrkB family protein [Acidithiobacillus sp.]|uniref:YihY/virulence factor BrkB family protein n=1 Tax=Acidithiobacillus sp. TaxID=1872118 RepID=UPI0025C4FB8D|nr:YihY/virulence factor BrkB family protein [Acidithiobacillus sp.]
MTEKTPPRQCFRQNDKALASVPEEHANRWQRMFYRVFRAWHGFWNDECIDRAGLLAYTTLFGLVPAMVLVFSLWNLVGFSPLHRAQVDHLILRSFVPRTGDAILRQVNSLAARGAQLGFLGVSGLGVTAIFLLREVERHFNAIWGVTPTCLWCRVLRYVAMLLVGPLSIALILPLLGPLQPLLAYLAYFPILPPFMSYVLTFLVVTVVMALLYKILSSAPTRWRDVFVGGVSAAILFDAAKIALAGYLQFSTFETIYGALGAFPIFLLWLYMAWASILFGAEMAAAAINL